MGIAAAIGVLSPFPFYYWLRSYPQTWVELCGKGRDPCKVMANVAHSSLFSQSLPSLGLPFFTSVPSLPLASSSTSGSISCSVNLVPFQYILLWTLGYVAMIYVESKKDPATRAKPHS